MEKKLFVISNLYRLWFLSEEILHFLLSDSGFEAPRNESMDNIIEALIYRRFYLSFTHTFFFLLQRNLTPPEHLKLMKPNLWSGFRTLTRRQIKRKNIQGKTENDRENKKKMICFTKNIIYHILNIQNVFVVGFNSLFQTISGVYIDR